MNITVGDYTIKYASDTGCYISKKGVVSGVTKVDTTTTSLRQISSEIASASYEKALYKMRVAYSTGEWPTDPCPHCGK